MSDDERGLIPAESERYARLLNDLRGIIAGGRQRAAAAVQTAVVLTYWRICERIVTDEQQGQPRAGYGEQLLKRLKKGRPRESPADVTVANFEKKAVE